MSAEKDMMDGFLVAVQNCQMCRGVGCNACLVDPIAPVEGDEHAEPLGYLLSGVLMTSATSASLPQKQYAELMDLAQMLQDLQIDDVNELMVKLGAVYVRSDVELSANPKNYYWHWSEAPLGLTDQEGLAPHSLPIHMSQRRRAILAQKERKK
jgi:hypothetical protein